MGTSNGAASDGRSRSIGHLRGLDGLRAISCLLVLLFHTGIFRGGWYGVDIFFVISGYLITSILLFDFDEHGRVDFVRFYRRRALRLFPAAWTFVAICCVTFWIIGPYHAQFTSNSNENALTGYLSESSVIRPSAVVSVLLYYANWLAVSIGGNTRLSLGPFHHFWSLAVEEQYYLVWPFFIHMALRWRGLRFALRACLALIAVVMVERALLWNVHRGMSLYVRTDTRCDEILIGAACAMLERSTPAFARFFRNGGARLDAMALALTLLIVGAVVTGSTGEVPGAFFNLGGYDLLAVCVAFLIMFLTTRGEASRVDRFMESRTMVWLGRRSYSIYLWQNWVLVLMLRVQRDVPAYLYPVGVAALCLVAHLSYTYVETPLMRRRPSDPAPSRLARG